MSDSDNERGYSEPREMEFTVTVTAGPDDVLTWTGYADNITDALYHAINEREGAGR
jgi:hypothetical protein